MLMDGTVLPVSPQDPQDAGRCVMVIRSLVPGSSAEQHGGLLPGDQLVSVNQVQMDQLTLSETVNLLKSVPAGTVRLGIRKPLVIKTSSGVTWFRRHAWSDQRSACVGGWSREKQRRRHRDNHTCSKGEKLLRGSSSNPQTCT